MMLSLGANAQHGKRREPGDYKRAYQIAVKYELAGAGDVIAVADLLRCSASWAEKLTRSARDAARAAFEAEAREALARREPVRATAERLGVSKDTVARAQRVAETDSPQMRQPQSDPIRAPSRADAMRADLAEMESPRAQRWHRALAALREINALDPVSALMAEPHRRLTARDPDLLSVSDSW